tara:strand:- start:619 stop:813 length:195 start_codon:yes stop_codon:yes gene_type:complete
MTIIWHEELEEAIDLIVHEFQAYGEVLQVHSCDDYCEMSGIGMLLGAIEHKSVKDRPKCPHPED